MNIKWYGQACFLITADNNTKILIDPFHKFPGYHLPDDMVDILTISHGHFDHNNTTEVNGQFKLFNKSGNYNVKNIPIVGIDTFHDDVNGSKRGNNVVFKYTIDGINICHLGDLGHLLSTEQLKQIGEVDVLLIPVGGVFTIDAEAALKVIAQLKPTVTIPMHYNTKAIESIGLGLDTVDKFLNLVNEKVTKEKILSITKDTLKDYQGIVVLNY